MPPCAIQLPIFLNFEFAYESTCFVFLLNCLLISLLICSLFLLLSCSLNCMISVDFQAFPMISYDYPWFRVSSRQIR